jgi:hypothetical protein
MSNEELYALKPHILDKLGRIALADEEERRRRRTVKDARDQAREFHGATETSD